MICMLRINGIRTGLILGISLVLAAMIYFFAANWGGLDRVEKIIVSAGLVLLFYVISFVLIRLKTMPAVHDFLSDIFLLAGCIAFGIAIALLNQIYNSHVDSYTIFMIWAIPALLLSWITRYNPFYVLSYTLVHLTLMFYFFPTSLSIDYSEGQLLGIGVLFVVLNLILFALTEMGRLKTLPIQFISFCIFHASLLLLTNSWIFERYGFWMNIPDLAVIAFGFHYFTRIRLNKTFLTLNALAASAFAVFKFIELAIRYASISFFFYGLIFVALLLTFNVWFFRFLNKLGDQQSERAENSTPEKLEKPNHEITGRVVSVIVTIIGVFIGSVSLIGVVLVATGLADPEYVLLTLSLLFIIPMIVLPRMNRVVRYTVLTIGYITGIASIVWIDYLGLSLLFLTLSIAGWIRLQGSKQRFLTYALMNLNVAIILFQMLEVLHNLDHEFTFIILLLTLLNAVLYALHFSITEGTLRENVRAGAFFFTLLFMFWLTFLGDIFPYSYELFNIIYFIVVTGLVFGLLRRESPFDAGLSLIFWFAFLVYKYYDIFWSLLHKSVTLALLGILTITVSYIFARRTYTESSIEENRGSGLLRRKWGWISLVVVLQFGILGVQAVRSEILLTTGAVVKLAITPLDPRSLLQGDYIALNYSISNPPEPVASQLRESRDHSKVRVVINPDDSGVYIFNRLWSSGEKLAEGELVINGKYSGWGPIRYGIESYFVPEGTGLAVQSKARFASVRVSADGDALLESLTER